MRHSSLLAIIILICSYNCKAQSNENIIIVTLDGMRWQEVFNGADSTLLSTPAYISSDSTSLFKKYFLPSNTDRRKLLMPFLWTTVVRNGQLYGNRAYNNEVDVMNKYWFSYPGYNEIFTGFPDTMVNSNDYIANPNENVLAFINNNKNYKNSVACFASWNAFKRILNEKKSGFLVNDGFTDVPESLGTPAFKTLNSLQHLLPDLYEGEERLDAVTGLMALEYMKTKHPKVLFVSLGETDEWAHAGKYDRYLEAAKNNDELIRLLWQQAQQDPFYKNKTTLIVTTDHGRGIDSEWTSHHNTVPHSNEIWIAAMGNKIAAKGEIKTAAHLYQQQLAQTIAYLAGLKFTANHPVAEKLDIFFKK